MKTWEKKMKEAQKAVTAKADRQAAIQEIKGRYMSFKNEGHEIYVEDIAKEGTLQDHAALALRRLLQVRAAMPKGTWTVTIEQELKAKHGYGVGAGGYEIYNPETNELTKAS